MYVSWYTFDRFVSFWTSAAAEEYENIRKRKLWFMFVHEWIHIVSIQQDINFEKLSAMGIPSCYTTYSIWLIRKINIHLYTSQLAFLSVAADNAKW